MTINRNINRIILLRLHQAEQANAFLNAEKFTDPPSQVVAYHMSFLEKKGLIEAEIVYSNIGDGRIGLALAKRLTSKGHDFMKRFLD